MNSVKPALKIRSLIAALITLVALYFIVGLAIQAPDGGGEPEPPIPGEISGLKKFSSQEEFKNYLKESSALYPGGFGFGRGGDLTPPPLDILQSPALDGKGGGPERISTTNVQVKDIDEPDIVKTNGQEIYFSPESGYFYPLPFLPENFSPPAEGDNLLEKFEKLLRGIKEGEVAKSLSIPPPEPIKTEETKIIGAYPPEDLKILGKIDFSGNLLLIDDTLVVLRANSVKGYNVARPESPKQSWKLELESNNFIETARLREGKIYLAISRNLDRGNPCPIPLFAGENQLSIPCIDIYHPISIVPIDTTYTVMIINPKDGRVERRISIVGSGYDSGLIIYMSPQAIYAAYGHPANLVKTYSNFIIEKARDIFPARLIQRINKLRGYDISLGSKLNELSVIIAEHRNSLSSDERLKFDNELSNRGADYFKAHARELDQTEIVKININNLTIGALGVIPGRLLNQFSLDEHKGYLRAAVTIGENRNWFLWNLGGINFSIQSANDVYVLDKNLKLTGSIKGLGLAERIYSARFVGDKGYLVTFREIDPFYVLDLSNPRTPSLSGELKIPGFSSYLDPLRGNLILGVGQEGSQVKLSLFDVSLASKPIEVDKYNLSEYWSEVSSNHHAFLHDDKFKVFFLPGGSGGYVFSYAGDKLELKRAVSGILAKRAVYLNDYLYVIGEDRIVVLDERDWSEVNRLTL